MSGGAHRVQATVCAVGWRALAATRAAWRASSSSETGAPAHRAMLQLGLRKTCSGFVDPPGR